MSVVTLDVMGKERVSGKTILVELSLGKERSVRFPEPIDPDVPG